MNLNSFVDNNLINDFMDQYSIINTDYMKLESALKKAERLKIFFEKLNKYLQNNWPLHVRYLIYQERDFIQNYYMENTIKDKTIISILDSAENEFRIVTKKFPILIEKACEKNNIPIDKKSRHPRYSFKNGFFQLEIQDKLGWALLKDYENTLVEFPCDIGAIIKYFLQENERIFNRNFEGEKFLKKIRHQYLAIINKSNKKDGDSLPIRKITSRLGKNEKGFRTDEFLIDLSKLLDEGPHEIDGCRIDLQQTKNTHQGLLLYGEGTRGYVGYIIFRRI